MAQRPLAIGMPAPVFALPTADGATLRLSDARSSALVLYFYPKDDTPGCTKEACGFRDTAGVFAKAGARIWGVSCDSPASHQRFAQKYHLTFPLLSDPDAQVCRAYGVYKQKSMYGRTYWGIERTTFLIDAAGRIAAIFPKVSVDGHIDEVLAALQALAAPAGAPAPARARATPR